MNAMKGRIIMKKLISAILILATVFALMVPALADHATGFNPPHATGSEHRPRHRLRDPHVGQLPGRLRPERP